MSTQTAPLTQTLLDAVLGLHRAPHLQKGIKDTFPPIAEYLQAQSLLIYRIRNSQSTSARLLKAVKKEGSAWVDWTPNHQPEVEACIAQLQASKGFPVLQCSGLTPRAGYLMTGALITDTHNNLDGLVILELPCDQEDKLYALYQDVAPYFEALTIALNKHFAEQKVKVQRNYLRKIIDNIPGLVFSKDKAGRFVLVNRRVAEIYGVPVEALIGKTDSDFNPYEDEVARYHKEDLQVIEHGQTLYLPDDKILTPQGEEVFLQTVKIPVPSEEDEGIMNVLGIAMDVSPWQKIKAEEAKSRERYLNFIKYAHEGIYYVQCDPPIPTQGCTPEEQTDLYYASAVIAECNRAMAEMYGLADPQELIGKRVKDLHAGAGWEENRQVTRSLFENNYQIKDFETHEVTPDGQERWFNNHVVGVFENQQMVGIWGGQMDITARKQMELSLIQQQEELELILEGARVGTWFWDLHKEEARFNEYFRKMLGYSSSEMPATPKAFNKLVHPEDLPGFIAKASRYLELRHKPEVFDHELRLLANDGTYKWVLNRGRAVSWDDQGRPTQGSGIFIDITARKEALLKLTAQQELLDMVSENASVAFWELHFDDPAAKMSSTFFKMLGYEPGAFEVTFDGFMSYIHPEDRDHFRETVIENINRGQGFEAEIRIKRKDSRYHWVFDRGQLYKIDGQTYLAGLIVDIDARKRAEIALKKSQEKLELAIEGSQIGVWEWDIPAQKLTNNALLFQKLGYSKEGFTGSYQDWVQHLHPDDVPRLEESFNLQTGASDSFRLEYRIKDTDGHYHWVFDTGKVTKRDESGAATHATGVTVDISEQKRAELALKNSKQRTELILDAAKIGLWEWHPKTDQCYYNFHWADMLGYDIEAIKPDVSAFYDLVHPEDEPRITKALQEQMAGQTPFFEEEIRLRTKDGQWKWVYDQGRVVERAEDGTAIRVAGVHVDIDIRKRAEEALAESEAFFRSLYEDSPLGILFCDAQGYIQQANGMAGVILGYSKAELEGMPIGNLSEAPAFLEDMLSQSEQNSQVSNLEHQLRHKDGRTLWANLLVSTIRDHKGQPENFIFSIEDITSRIEAKQALQRSQELQKATLNALPDMKFRVDKDLRFISFYNSKKEPANLLMPPEEFLGRTATAVLPAHIAKALEVNLKKALEEDQVHAFEYLLPMGGENRYYEARVSRINNAEAIVVVRDITTLKTTQQNLQKKLRELDRNNETLTRYVNSNLQLENFAHTVSHDLREPVRTMNSFSQLLKRRYKDALDEDAHSYLDFIGKSANHMNKLIEDLLEFARFTNSEEHGFEEVNLQELLQTVEQSLRGLIKDKKAEVVIPQTLPTLYGNPTKLGQLFQNLVSNGIKFNKKGEKPVVTIKAEEKGAFWQFSIKDNGIGIEREHHGQIFQLFRRLHSKKHYPGSGIGLSLCKRVVEQHGGEIWVESQPGEGANFIFTLHKNY